MDRIRHTIEFSVQFIPARWVSVIFDGVCCALAVIYWSLMTTTSKSWAEMASTCPDHYRTQGGGYCIHNP